MCTGLQCPLGQRFLGSRNADAVEHYISVLRTLTKDSQVIAAAFGVIAKDTANVSSQVVSPHKQCCIAHIVAPLLTRCMFLLPCRTVPCHALPCPALPCPALPCPALPCCAVLCCAGLGCAVLCCAVLCCAVLCKPLRHCTLFLPFVVFPSNAHNLPSRLCHQPVSPGVQGLFNCEPSTLPSTILA